LGGTAPSSGLEVRRSPTPLAVIPLIVMWPTQAAEGSITRALAAVGHITRPATETRQPETRAGPRSSTLDRARPVVHELVHELQRTRATHT
jgi:hypothetical protein